MNPLKRKLSSTTTTPSKRFSSPWDAALLLALNNPKQHLHADDQIVIIRDCYPKSRHHYLLMPKGNLDNLQSLTPNHVPLLEHMIKEAKAFAEREIIPRTNNMVRYGFHMVPSMRHLHMHVISQDFDSVCLKNKKHWNSFTTAFFVDADKVVEMLRKDGKVVFEKERGEKLLKEDLFCHVCKGGKLANIPKLKEHIRFHDKDKKEGMKIG